MGWMLFILSHVADHTSEGPLNLTHSEASWSSSSSSRRTLCTAHISELFKRTWPIQLRSRAFTMRSALNNRCASHDVTIWCQHLFIAVYLASPFVLDPLLKRWKHYRCVQGSGRRYGSTDMPHDLFRSGRDLDLGSNLPNDIVRSNRIILHSTRFDERNTMLAKWMSCLCGVKRYYRKIFFR